MPAVPPRDPTASVGERAIPPRDANTSVGEQAVPERPVSSDYWQKVDQLFYATMDRAKTVFRSRLAINYIIVAVGVLLMGISIYSFLAKGNDFSSATFAGLGVVDFSTTFFLNPQKEIQKSIGKLVGIQVVYRSYLTQLEYADDEERLLYEAGHLTLDAMLKVIDAVKQITADAIARIEELDEEK